MHAFSTPAPEGPGSEGTGPQGTGPQGTVGAGSGSDAIGLDIGGTKTHGIRLRDGAVIAEAVAGSANVQNVSVEAARASLADVFTRLGTRGVTRVIAGSGGVDTEQDAAALRALISAHVPDAAVDVVHDTRLILAAGSASEGIAVIAGTGSVAWGTNAAGRQARSGGWGYLLGDEGSGYWIGREAVRHSLRLNNLGREPDALSTALLQAVDLSDPTELIGLFHGGTDRRYWAGKAGLVFEAARAGSPAATDIVHTAAEHLAGLTTDVARLLKISGPVVVGGGLGMHQPLFQDLLRTRLNAAGLADVRYLNQDPVFGTAYLLGTERAGHGS
mgnify:CR=1 FL=1